MRNRPTPEPSFPADRLESQSSPAASAAQRAGGVLKYVAGRAALDGKLATFRSIPKASRQAVDTRDRTRDCLALRYAHGRAAASKVASMGKPIRPGALEVMTPR